MARNVYSNSPCGLARPGEVPTAAPSSAVPLLGHRAFNYWRVPVLEETRGWFRCHPSRLSEAISRPPIQVASSVDVALRPPRLGASRDVVSPTKRSRSPLRCDEAVCQRTPRPVVPGPARRRYSPPGIARSLRPRTTSGAVDRAR